MSNKLYVGNMNYRTSEETLRGLFEAHGTVNSVTIIYDRQTGQSKGFGFVEMESPEAAEAAIEALNEQEVEGRRLRVNVAQPREEGARKPRRF
ncbi:MAG: RNA-binding protein [Spirochaetaceae bacterium]|nr:MAG: RNA-binding protein [Spirochaetaceae bacterium]